MKRLFALCVCLLLCATLFCGCNKKGDDVSVDINAPTHTLEEFPREDFHCRVTLQNIPIKEGNNGATYRLDGQEAVDLYNLLDREHWLTADEVSATSAENSRPPVDAKTLVSMDFYGGKNADNAKQYYGTFQFSETDEIFMSSGPFDTQMSHMFMQVGTCEEVLKFVKEKGTSDK